VNKLETYFLCGYSIGQNTQGGVLISIPAHTVAGEGQQWSAHCSNIVWFITLCYHKVYLTEKPLKTCPQSVFIGLDRYIKWTKKYHLRATNRTKNCNIYVTGCRRRV